jgi:HK97 family phage prohead protease
MEKRFFQLSELRASKSGSKKVSGYAARYNVLSHMLPGGFKERIAKRAFDKVLAGNPDVVCTFNHDNNQVMGRTSSGTLQLRGDDDGLGFTCDLPNTSAARDLHELVTRGDIKECSFAFMLGDEDQDWNEEDDLENERGSSVGRAARVIVRTIKNFSKLVDVSLVTSPAYPGTQVDARNIVTAEVRSRVAALTAEDRVIGGMTLKDRLECAAWLKREDARDAARDVRNRRTRMLALIDQV